MDKIEKLRKIMTDLNKECSALYGIINEKNKLIEMQRHYIWELIQEIEEIKEKEHAERNTEPAIPDKM